MSAERILVVDDEEAIREIVCSMLTNAGHHTRQASSGLKALEILNSGAEFELILNDDSRPCRTDFADFRSRYARCKRRFFCQRLPLLVAEGPFGRFSKAFILSLL